MRETLSALVGVALGTLGSFSANATPISICNDFTAPVHAALAAQTDAGYAARGWWTAAPNACTDAEFDFTSGTLFYTGDSDWYRNGRKRSRDHWGNKLKLYVSKGDFKSEAAEKPRRGASAEMFSSADISAPPAGKSLTITVRFHQGGTTIQSTTK